MLYSTPKHIIHPHGKEVFGESSSRAGVQKPWFFPFDQEEWIRPNCGTEIQPGKDRNLLITIVQKTCIGLDNHNVEEIVSLSPTDLSALAYSLR